MVEDKFTPEHTKLQAEGIGMLEKTPSPDPTDAKIASPDYTVLFSPNPGEPARPIEPEALLEILHHLQAKAKASRTIVNRPPGGLLQAYVDTPTTLSPPTPTNTQLLNGSTVKVQLKDRVDCEVLQRMDFMLGSDLKDDQVLAIIRADAAAYLHLSVAVPPGATARLIKTRNRCLSWDFGGISTDPVAPFNLGDVHKGSLEDANADDDSLQALGTASSGQKYAAKKLLTSPKKGQNKNILGDATTGAAGNEGLIEALHLPPKAVKKAAGNHSGEEDETLVKAAQEASIFNNVTVGAGGSTRTRRTTEPKQDVDDTGTAFGDIKKAMK